jgi:luciferase family oxidoreductase group 1
VIVPPFSILDLAPIVRGGTAADSFRNTLDLAQHAEMWGYQRYWLAEHHNFAGIASAATSVVIGYVAGGTSRIRVGSGGIMLPNHSPLVIAEQFGTLASLYPGRIDLGLGRAPGTDPRTTQALRRDPMRTGDTFPQDLEELRGYFRASAPGQAVHAVPGEGLNVPIWLLGSSTFSAELAARLGLPFAFAWHFAPEELFAALEVYRETFRPSESLDRPYAMIGVNIFAADTDAEAERLFTSLQQQFLQHIRRGTLPLQPPVETMDGRWTASEEAYVQGRIRGSIVGSPETIRRGLEALIAETGVNEILATAQIFDHAARLHSFEIVADIRKALQTQNETPGQLRPATLETHP